MGINENIFNCVAYLQIKDDEHLLFYWIEHHFNLGFAHLYIVDDLSTIPIQKTLETHPNFKKMTIIRLDFDSQMYADNSIYFVNSRFYDAKIPKKDLKQLYVLNWFIKNYKKQFNWILVCDVDEFLFLRKYNNINNYVNYYADKYKDLGAILFYWCIFGSSYLDYFPNNNLHLFENFVMSEYVLSSFGKMIVKVECIEYFTHFHLTYIKNKKVYTPCKQSLHQMVPVNQKLNKFYSHSPSSNISFSSVNAYLAHYMTTDSYNYIKRRFYRLTANNREKSLLTITWLSRFNDVYNKDMLKYIKNPNINETKTCNMIVSLKKYNFYYKTSFNNIIDMYKHFFEKKNVLFYEEFNKGNYQMIRDSIYNIESIDIITQKYKYYNLLYTHLTKNLDKKFLDHDLLGTQLM